MHKWATSWLTILKFNSSYTEVQEWARKWRQAFEMDRKGELQEATGKCGVSFQNWQAKTHCDSLHISTKKVGMSTLSKVCVCMARGDLFIRPSYIYIHIIWYYEFSLLHIFSLVLQPWMSAYIRKTDGVYISVPKND